MFSRLFKKDPLKPLAAKHYDSLVNAARRPFLYAENRADDSVDGRFEMIVIHAVILMRRLQQGDEDAKKLSQLVFDRMFDDMDAALREMGTGDLSVGKKIRAMGEVFYGRADTYGEALKSEDTESLRQAIARNVGLEVESEGARFLSDYVIRSDKAVQAQPISDLLNGEPGDFPNL